MGESAHDLAYRLYATCDRMKWAKEALAYNSLIISWTEIARLMHAADRKREAQRFITGDEKIMIHLQMQKYDNRYL